MMANRFQRQRGFTIIELLVATTTGLLLTIGVMTIMYQSAGMADIMRGQIVMNQQAREMFRILTDGGMGAAGAVAGLRGSKEGSTVGVVGASQYRMSLTDGANTVLSSQLAPRQVTCTAAGEPLSDCISNEVKSVTGYLAAAPILDEPPGNNTPWAMVKVELIDPDIADSRLAGKGDAVDSFYAVIGLNKEAP